MLRVWQAFASIYGFVGAFVLIVDLCRLTFHPSAYAAYAIGEIAGCIVLVYLPIWLAIRTENKRLVQIAMIIAVIVNILAFLRLFHCMIVPVGFNNCS